MNKIVEIFQAQGKEQTLSSTHFHSLSKEGVIWAFVGAPLNLFLTSREKPHIRHFLMPYKAPLFIGLFPSKEYDLVAVSSEETKYYELPMESLEAHLKDLSLCQEFADLIQEWTSALSPCFTQPMEEGTQETISPPDPVELPAGHTLVFAQSLSRAQTVRLWIEVLEGKLFPLGFEELALTEHFCPLTPDLWFHIAEKAKVRAIESLTLVQDHLWRKALSSFSKIFSAYLPTLFSEKEKQDHELLEERHREQEENVEVALKRLEEVLIPPSIPIIKKTGEELKQACLLIGSFLEIEFTFPQQAFTPKKVEDQLTIICDASHIQKRKVKLESEWWKTDHGPLLGFHGSEEKPVVLLNPSTGKYEMVDLDQRVRVDATIAKDLSPTAFMFYVSLPEEIDSGKKLIFFFLKKYAKIFLHIFFYGSLGGIVSFFFPIATKLLFTYAIPENDLSLVIYLTLGLLFATIGFSAFYFFRSLLFLRLEGLSSNLIQPALWDRVLKLPLTFFQKYSAGNLFWRLASVEEIRMLLTGHAASVILGGIFSLFYLFIMAVYSPLLTLIAFGFALIGFAVTAVCAALKIDVLHKLLEVQGNLKGFMIQMVSGIAKLRTSGAEKNAFSHWASAFATNKSLELRSQNIQNFITTASKLLPILTVWGVYATLVAVIGVEGLPLADFLAFNTGLGSFILAIYPLNSMIVQLCNVVPLWKRGQVILETRPEIKKGKAPAGRLLGKIFLDSVSFSYTDSPQILSNVTIEVKAHEFIAIVGPSGSGKSTVLRLLLGLEKPTSGGIYYDGKDLDSIDVQAVRRQIGSVLQGDELSSGSLYDNLTQGKTFTKSQVMQAIHLAGFEKDFEALPMGFHTYIPMHGSTFSGGQRQRLLLARALLHHPSILIFDEATSALDNRTQETIMQNICALNLTRVFVAQRLSTVKKADRIYVIEKGAVIQQGSFTELAKAPGLFSEMLARQKL